MSESKLEVVCATYDVLYAEVIKAALEGEGIRTMISNEHQAGLSGVLEVQVCVTAEDAERAREFIREHEAARASEDVEDAADEEADEEAD